MPAYVIAEVDVHDAAAYEEYKAGVPASLAEHGGRFLARGGSVEPLEGGWDPGRVVVIEFDDLVAARRWYDSDGYSRLRSIRQSASEARIVAVEGVE